MLSAHYRSPLNFSDELMEAARTAWTGSAPPRQPEFPSGESAGRSDDFGRKGASGGSGGFAAKFDEAMEDDFNTADAIAAIFELVKFANTNSGAENTAAYLKALLDEIKELSDVCGLIVEKKKKCWMRP
ncbi:MAG: DALR domain-containing protein [Clostridium sp.]